MENRKDDYFFEKSIQIGTINPGKNGEVVMLLSDGGFLRHLKI
jgi:hypothetical protein